MNDILTQLDQLKEEIHLINEEAKTIGKSFCCKVVTLFIEAMAQYGLDELLLMPLTPSGYLKDSLEDDDFDFDCDCDDLVDCPFEVLYAGKITKTSEGKKVPIVTRFGIKNGQLLFHTTTLTMYKDGDLTFSIVDKDNPQQPWLPISEFKSSRNLVELLFTFLNAPGNWMFSKEHPECCFLHRSLDEEIKNRIKKYSGECNLSEIFKDYHQLEDIDLSSLDASKAITVQAMFYHCENLHKLDVSSLNTSRCTSFESMLDGCINLEDIHFGDFITAKGETMQEMFRDCKSLKCIDLSSFDTSRCENMKMMFRGCTSLESLSVSNFRVEKCVNMKGMFSYCSSLESLDLSYIDASHCLNMWGMFYGCTSLVSIDFTYFLTDNCRIMESMFCNCSSLQSLDLSSFDTSNCQDMSAMFQGCSSLTTLDLSNFNVKELYFIDNLFAGCKNLQELNLDNWDLGSLTPMKIEDMFTDCNKLSKIYLRNSNGQTLFNIRSAIEQAGLKGVEIITD